jgi:hypothetical protein
MKLSLETAAAAVSLKLQLPSTLTQLDAPCAQ